MSRGIEALVDSGEYSTGIDVLTDTFRVFLENKPEKKTLIGTELYRCGQVSLMRASEIAGMDFESFGSANRSWYRYQDGNSNRKGVNGRKSNISGCCE